ncbi:MAG: hypothetical protein K2O14_15250, partial [Oscillospiraceae bacterium]|nr:hypothetical protein [Oscillospiraceae bacterium]
YTPQHLSAEIYPNAQSQSAGGTQSAEGNAGTNTNAANAGAGGTADNSAQAGQAGQTGQPNQSLGDAFGAAGRAIGEAAKAAGHAIGEAFSADAVKTAGRNAAEAAKNASGVVADKVKAAAENARNAHQTHQAYHNGQPETAVPRPTDEAREYNSTDRRGEIPPQYGTKAGAGKGFSFKDVKGMPMNPSFGKLFGCICLDLFVWSWLIALLGSVAVEVGLGGFGWCVMHGLNGLFVGLGSYHIISRVFYGIAMISLGVILLLLGILLVKGIIKLVKHIVLMHVKALYDL